MELNKIDDNRLINVSVSGRLNSLNLPWLKVKNEYILEFFGEVALLDAETHLKVSGSWSAKCNVGTLFLNLK